MPKVQGYTIYVLKSKHLRQAYLAGGWCHVSYGRQQPILSPNARYAPSHLSDFLKYLYKRQI